MPLTLLSIDGEHRLDVMCYLLLDCPSPALSLAAARLQYIKFDVARFTHTKELWVHACGPSHI